jgi:hypothetical protein
MEFRASFCDPLEPVIMEMGVIGKEQILDTFQRVDWSEYLQKMEGVKESDIYFSPSLDVENIVSKQGITVSAVGSANDFEFYIFYKRPKAVKTLFGFREKVDDNYVTDISGQTEKDVLECLTALVDNNSAFLERKLGK